MSKCTFSFLLFSSNAKASWYILLPQWNFIFSPSSVLNCKMWTASYPFKKLGLIQWNTIQPYKSRKFCLLQQYAWTWKHYAKWNKPDTENKQTYDLTYVWNLKKAEYIQAGYQGSGSKVIKEMLAKGYKVAVRGRMNLEI